MIRREHMMKAFENMVFSAVRDTLGDKPFSAEWFHGTLFVNVDEDGARAVFHKLTYDAGLGHIILTKVTHGEYAYDFV